MADGATQLITAQLESFREGLEELKPLLPDHWRELGLYQDRMPLDPDFDQYFAREDAGQLVYCTLRVNGTLQGYFIGVVVPGLHYQTTLTCHMDICLIRPAFRGIKAGRVLFDAVEAELRRRGVKMWWVGSKNHKPIVGFFEALGFIPEEVHLARWLDA